MAPSSRDRISVDLRGLKAALFEQARARGVSPSDLVRAVLADALDQAEPPIGEQSANGTVVPAEDRVRLSLRMTRRDALAAMTAARAAGLSPGAYVAGLVAGVPVLTSGGARSDHLAALIASSAELSTLSRNLHHLTSLLREGSVRAAQEYREMLVRYIEWLNVQCRRDGQPWSKGRRASPYTALRKLLQWLARCRPGVITGIDYPFSPFPWRDRDNQPHDKITAHDLRAILNACEQDITEIRSTRDSAKAQQAAADGSLDTLGGLLQHIDRYCDGIVPTVLERLQPGQHKFYAALARFGGMREIEPCLYPRSESLLPYFLTILIHTAGNPEPIVNLQRDCLQFLPLLDDRQTLVWRKGRTPHMQRRTFSIAAEFEPPTLVRELLQWNERLQALAPPTLRERLFLFKTKGHRAVTALSASIAKRAVKTFCAQHALPAFSLASIRPSVLSAFYRTSGDLRQVRTVANHVRISTTVRYVEAPEVLAQNRTRVAALQSAFVGHFGKHPAPESAADPVATPQVPVALRPAQAVSLFGFGCKDPLAGTAPGTRSGELCMNFMGCFTCPNAIITPEPAIVARLLQARDHLRAAATTLHPARWRVMYAPQLRILEEDILTRFSARETAAAEPLLSQLPPLPELR